MSCLQQFADWHPQGHVDMRLLSREKLPTMLRSETGEEIFFSESSLDSVAFIARTWHASMSLDHAIRAEQFENIVRQALVDGYCVGDLTSASQTLLGDLKRRIWDALAAARRHLTHYFPCWSLGIADEALAVGPVRFLSVDAWLAEVDFVPSVRDSFFCEQTPHEGWKARFARHRQGALPDGPMDLASVAARVVGDCTHVATVSVPDCDTELSRRRARLAAQAALDAVALMWAEERVHRELVLRDEPSTAPGDHGDLTASPEGLWPPSTGSKRRGSSRSVNATRDMVRDWAQYLEACGRVLDEALFHSCRTNASSWSLLAQRWLTALMWAGEAARTGNDAVSSAKYATCLDILAHGNDSGRILEMLLRVLGVDNETKIDVRLGVRRETLSMKKAVEAIYGRGRSKVLHGQIVNPLDRHDYERALGAKLARDSLRVAVQKWAAADSGAGYEDFRDALG